MGEIDWNTEAKDIVNKVRALYPWPKAYFYYKGIKVYVLEAEVSPLNGEVGKIIDIKEKGILVGSKSGAVCIKKVQPENRKIMNGSDFANGYRIRVGENILNG